MAEQYQAGLGGDSFTSFLDRHTMSNRMMADQTRQQEDRYHSGVIDLMRHKLSVDKLLSNREDTQKYIDAIGKLDKNLGKFNANFNTVPEETPKPDKPKFAVTDKELKEYAKARKDKVEVIDLTKGKTQSDYEYGKKFSDYVTSFFEKDSGYNFLGGLMGLFGGEDEPTTRPPRMISSKKEGFVKDTQVPLFNDIADLFSVQGLNPFSEDKYWDTNKETGEKSFKFGEVFKPGWMD